MVSPSHFLPPLPDGLADLTELALDLERSWGHATDALLAEGESLTATPCRAQRH